MYRISLLLFACCISAFSLNAQITMVPFATGASNPVDIKNCGDERLFVLDQQGYIYIYDTAGSKLSTPFLNIQARTKFGSEQGLLGLAFPKDFHERGYFYVNYTAQTRGNTRISRFHVTPLDSNIADPNSEEILLEIWQPYSNHNGGHLAFGPDGYLYIGTGDGGSGGDPQNRAQNPDSLLGKLLRIEVDPSYPGYKIPPSNPFVCNPNPGREEIWAVGMRNPWRWSFDRCTGDLWIGDVGQGNVEEVDFQPANAGGGLNYGWRCYEGTSAYDLSGGCGPFSNYVAPVATYTHTSGRCSITGGYVYRGARYNDLYGTYFYTDYCSPVIYTITRDSTGGFVNTTLGTLLGSSLSCFGEDMWGEIYTASVNAGNIYKFVTNDCTPVAAINCNKDTVGDCGYGFVELSVPPGRDYTYEWYYNGTLMSNDSSNKIMATQAGTYSVNVTNPSTACSNSDTIEVTLGTGINLSINNLDTLYCVYNQSVNMQPSIPGGYFSGDGVECFSFNPSLAGEGMHEVKYVYTTAKGCRYETSKTVRVDACLGSNGITWLNTISFYPNPNDGLFYLDVYSDKSKTLHIEITDILGKSMHTESVRVNSGRTKINPSFNIEAAGIYLVHLSDERNSVIHRISVR